ncbi:MAG: hypothetical protein QOJ28_1905 [Mycobacterium sp.]|jgi:hypothetical protein|nr:hypothetical protein [Mycobacterium sp.]
MSNLALNLVATATRIPDRTAAITGEQTMTYADLDGIYPAGHTARARRHRRRSSGRHDAAEHRGSADRLLRRNVIPPTEEA